MMTSLVAAASRGLIERALQCPEDSGLADLVVGGQGRHGLACGVALSDLSLLTDVQR